MEEKKPEKALSRFIEIFMPIADKHAPLKKITTKDHPNPWWWNDDLIQLIQKRDEEGFTSKEDQKKISKMFKDIKETFLFKSEEAPKDPTNMLNVFFLYYNDERAQQRQEDLPLLGSSESRLNFEIVNDSKIEDLLKSLPESLTPGTDEIDARLLKVTARYISAPIRHIMNRCIDCGEFPSQWKNSKILLASQSGNAYFRPKHVLPVLSQILEKILVEQMRKHFTNNNLFAQHQKTLHEMTQDLPTEPNNGAEGAQRIQEIKEGLNSFLDTISPEMLIDNLKSNNFSQEAVTMMKSFLSDRRQKVYYNSCPSHWRKDCGLPQGSCLAYFLFSVYTNDLKHLFNHIFSCYGRQLLHNTSFS